MAKTDISGWSGAVRSGTKYEGGERYRVYHAYLKREGEKGEYLGLPNFTTAGGAGRFLDLALAALADGAEGPRASAKWMFLPDQEEHYEGEEEPYEVRFGPQGTRAGRLGPFGGY
jgi:hypothetical protein